jgi:hypothetical protein
MATAIEQLDAMRRLGDNWDGYGAAAPQASAIDLAQEFVGLFEALLSKFTAHSCTLHVNPTRVGGVLIELEDPLKQHEVEINPDRSIGFLHHDRGTGQMETRKFVPENQAVVNPDLTL